MYLEIDEGYFEHPKTLDLCAKLQDQHADVYPIRMWKWACRSAKTGKLGRISSFAVEKAIGYPALDGKCFEALCQVGFLDRDSDGACEIHGWMDYTGGAIKRMDDAAESKKRWRAHKDGKCVPPCEWCETKPKTSKDSPRTVQGQSIGRPLDKPTQSSPDKSSQDQSSPDKSSQDPEREYCAEPADAAPALLVFPCCGTPGEWSLTEERRSEWAAAYPGVDILAEARKALAWLHANPTKGKTARGMAKFLIGWMGRTQNASPIFGRQVLPFAPRQDIRVGHARAEDFEHNGPPGEVKDF